MRDQIRTSPFFREALLIDGAWTPADGGKTLPVHDPATGEEIGTAPLAGAPETTRAIEAANRAFPAWAARTAADRAALLQALAADIRANADALAAMLTLEQGKPLAEAKGEIMIGAAYVQWFAEEARRVRGDVIPSPWPDRKLFVTREPVGVVGAITPWNFPFSMLARKLGATLAAGCTVVAKPSEFTPYSGLAWGVLAERAGIPAGVVNLVTGDAPAIGKALTDHPDVRKITFTGSTRVGKLLSEQAAKGVKRVSMELGGNAPFLVFADADLDKAVEGAVAAKYRNSGQTCVCTNRFYVEASIHDAFAERLAARAKSLVVGSGFTEGALQGPLINDAALAKVEAHVADALEKGGRLLTGGRRHALGGTFYEPTVISGGHAGMTVARDETFGPLAVLIPFETEAEAIAAANATEYGLAAYVYTRDLARAFRVSGALKYGMVGVNDGVITTEVAPFGGVKESGMGREGSHYGLDDYLDMKYLSIGGL
ncbi:NAD-dependent succinate-semialdehyde dehydrogenase [Methylopila sp. Yamaguchi]|uniref:NAD-dependent succinate-semialdehyde dehydrogenase n=1 Tax=Methylopila sp. Yamaguchi TaxID=1437817 RepID=UPI000CBD070D|nr:NAD-dependent succinate-semialdehyde dehydrogenase [Methylopila sp. Yamaguchi]GBD47201.1 succinic semialdehyde dehydrogenase [Methylopila sp. Yamaguchi]